MLYHTVLSRIKNNIAYRSVKHEIKQKIRERRFRGFHETGLFESVLSCFSLLLGNTAATKEIENNAYAKFWGANKVHYGR